LVLLTASSQTFLLLPVGSFSCLRSYIRCEFLTMAVLSKLFSLLPQRRFLIVVLCATFVHGGYFNNLDLPADNSTVPFVDCNGQPTKNASLTCGVTKAYCLQKTVASPGWSLFTWNQFVPMFATWLAPWLALTAQLPYETKQRLTNLMSLLMVLGSPHLAAYSLSLMLLNARWINKSFRQLRQEAKHISLQPQRPEQYDAFESIRWILIEMQHVPTKVVQGPHHDFAQMIVRPENAKAWKDLAKDISKTKREKTLSLFVQLGWVIAMQVLSIVQFFTTAANDNSVVLGLAVNSLWTWMIPLVWGWVFVGTQNFARSLGEAFQAIHPPNMTSPAATRMRRVDSHREEQEFQIADEMMRNWTYFLADRTDESQSMGFKTFMGFSVAGWERQPGPLFVFARVYSIRVTAQHIERAFNKLRRQQKLRKTVHGNAWNETDFAANLRGTAEQTARYIFLFQIHSRPNMIAEDDELEMEDRTEGVEKAPDLAVHCNAPAGIAHDCFIAACIGLLLQWGTTGSAILIAYM
jgi:hypothetical protein